MKWTLGALIGLGLLSAAVAGSTLVPHGQDACNLPPTKSYGDEATGLIRIVIENDGAPGHFRICLQDKEGMRERIEFMLTDEDDHVAEMRAPPKEVAYGIAYGGGWLGGITKGIYSVDLAKCPGHVYEARLSSRTGLFTQKIEGPEGCSGASASSDQMTEQGIPLLGDPQAPRTPPMPGWVAGSVLFATMSVGLGAVAWHRLPSLRAWTLGLFTRLLQPDLLQQENRAKIHELVKAEPGIHGNDLVARLELSHGVVDYHLGVLVRSHVLARVDLLGRRCYFEYGRYSPTEMRRMATMRVGRLSPMMDLIRSQPGQNSGEIARRLCIPRSKASKMVAKLEKAGFVKRRQVGREVFVDPV